MSKIVCLRKFAHFKLEKMSPIYNEAQFFASLRHILHKNDAYYEKIMIRILSTIYIV